MNSKNHPDCNNCATSCIGQAVAPTHCSKYTKPREGFPLPEMISRITFFHKPSPEQVGLRQKLSR